MRARVGEVQTVTRVARPHHIMPRSRRWYVSLPSRICRAASCSSGAGRAVVGASGRKGQGAAGEALTAWAAPAHTHPAANIL